MGFFVLILPSLQSLYVKTARIRQHQPVEPHVDETKPAALQKMPHRRSHGYEGDKCLLSMIWTNELTLSSATVNSLSSTVTTALWASSLQWWGSFTRAGHPWRCKAARSPSAMWGTDRLQHTPHRHRGPPERMATSNALAGTNHGLTDKEGQGNGG